jgi:hypothetical protein
MRHVSEASVRAETSAAERFLKQTNLSAITGQLDPLGLVEVVSGQPRIQTTHRAIVSIRDYIDRNGTVEGKRLGEHFSQPRFGWSQDTLRYISAAMLVAGKITLKISGREVKAVGQQALERQRQRLEAERTLPPTANDEPRKIKESIRVRARVTTREQLSQLLQSLQALQAKLPLYGRWC